MPSVDHLLNLVNHHQECCRSLVPAIQFGQIQPSLLSQHTCGSFKTRLWTQYLNLSLKIPGQIEAQNPSSGLLPNPAGPPPSSLRMGGPPLLPSPTSQFLMPSPSGFLNLYSPRSPYPMLSPGYQFPPPLTPNFAFSPMGQAGILGPGPQPPLSPGIVFPLSPGFFPVSSPRWRDQ